jgi:hypothetical protein
MRVSKVLKMQFLKKRPLSIWHSYDIPNIGKRCFLLKKENYGQIYRVFSLF